MQPRTLYHPDELWQRGTSYDAAFDVITHPADDIWRRIKYCVTARRTTIACVVAASDLVGRTRRCILRRGDYVGRTGTSILIQ